MAKLNVNSATREQLVDVAGVRPQVADAILKHRDEQGGKIADLDALNELPGVGPATIDQLRGVLSFTAQAAKDATDKAGEAAQKGAEITAFAAKSGAETVSFAAKSGAETAKRATEKTAEAGREVARAGAETASRLTTIGADAAKKTMAVVGDAEKQAARQSTEVVSEIGELFVGLVKEQMQHNVEVLQSLARVRGWREALDVQNDYLRASIERMTRGTTRYVEVVTKMTAGMANLARDEAKKAA